MIEFLSFATRRVVSRRASVGVEEASRVRGVTGMLMNLPCNLTENVPADDAPMAGGRYVEWRCTERIHHARRIEGMPFFESVAGLDSPYLSPLLLFPLVIFRLRGKRKVVRGKSNVGMDGPWLRGCRDVDSSV